MRSNHLGKFNEVTFPSLRALLLVLERTPFESAAREINEIDFGLLEFDAQVPAVIRSRAAGLEFHRVDLDTDDEAWVVDAAVHFFDDLEDDAAAVIEIAAVLICALIGREGEELG